MEPVVLEGDYSSYFKLFADKNEQVQSRYILDPKAMVFTIDFCKAFYWEIQNGNLYFASNQELPSLDIIDTFIREIRPAIELPNTDVKNAANLAYTDRTYHTLTCPLCHKELQEGPYWRECPDGHGCLVTGEQMSNMRELPKTEIERFALTPVKVRASKPRPLICPYCTHAMSPTPYQNTSVTIDVCGHCGYRWFDPHELKTTM